MRFASILSKLLNLGRTSPCSISLIKTCLHWHNSEKAARDGDMADSSAAEICPILHHPNFYPSLARTCAALPEMYVLAALALSGVLLRLAVFAERLPWWQTWQYTNVTQGYNGAERIQYRNSRCGFKLWNLSGIPGGEMSSNKCLPTWSHCSINWQCQKCDTTLPEIQQNCRQRIWCGHFRQKYQGI